MLRWNHRLRHLWRRCVLLPLRPHVATKPRLATASLRKPGRFIQVGPAQPTDHPRVQVRARKQPRSQPESNRRLFCFRQKLFAHRHLQTFFFYIEKFGFWKLDPQGWKITLNRLSRPENTKRLGLSCLRSALIRDAEMAGNCPLSQLRWASLLLQQAFPSALRDIVFQKKIKSIVKPLCHSQRSVGRSHHVYSIFYFGGFFLTFPSFFEQRQPSTGANSSWSHSALLARATRLLTTFHRHLIGTQCGVKSSAASDLQDTRHHTHNQTSSHTQKRSSTRTSKIRDNWDTHNAHRLASGREWLLHTCF